MAARNQKNGLFNNLKNRDNDGSIATGSNTVISVEQGGTNNNEPLNNDRVVGTDDGKIVERDAMTNGQLIIGSTGSAPVNAQLTAGLNTLINNGPGSITVSGRSHNIANVGTGATVYTNSTHTDTGASQTTTHNFRSIAAGSGISITQNTNSIDISSTIVGQNLGTGTGVYSNKLNNTLRFKSITGSGGTSVSNGVNEINIHTESTSTNGENLGIGVGVYFDKLDDTLRFKSIVGSGATSVSSGLHEVTVHTPPAITNVQNQGTGASVLKDIVGTNTARLKSLVAGDNITLTQGTDEITINASTSGAGDITGGTNLGSGTGVFAQKNTPNLEFKTLLAGPNISLTDDENHITISASAPDAFEGGDVYSDTTTSFLNDIAVFKNTGGKTIGQPSSGTRININSNGLSILGNKNLQTNKIETLTQQGHILLHNQSMAIGLANYEFSPIQESFLGARADIEGLQLFYSQNKNRLCVKRTNNQVDIVGNIYTEDSSFSDDTNAAVVTSGFWNGVKQHPTIKMMGTGNITGVDQLVCNSINKSGSGDLEVINNGVKMIVDSTSVKTNFIRELGTNGVIIEEINIKNNRITAAASVRIHDLFLTGSSISSTTPVRISGNVLFDQNNIRCNTTIIPLTIGDANGGSVNIVGPNFQITTTAIRMNNLLEDDQNLTKIIVLDAINRLYTKTLDPGALEPAPVYTASNLGSGEQIYANKVGTDFRFKTLTSTNDTIDITSTANTVNLSMKQSTGEFTRNLSGAVTASGYIYYLRKIGGVVTARFPSIDQSTNGSTLNYVGLGTLPLGFRPIQDNSYGGWLAYRDFFGTNFFVPAIFWVRSDGVVRVVKADNFSFQTPVTTQINIFGITLTWTTD